MAGNSIGISLDEADRLAAARSTQKALETVPSGQSLPWRNPKTGHHGSVTPIRTYPVASGKYCREFQETIVVGGRRQKAYGTACRQPDGTWKIKQ